MPVVSRVREALVPLVFLLDRLDALGQLVHANPNTTPSTMWFGMSTTMHRVLVRASGSVMRLIG
jgi:hypothetical protein